MRKTRNKESSRQVQKAEVQSNILYMRGKLQRKQTSLLGWQGWRGALNMKPRMLACFHAIGRVWISS